MSRPPIKALFLDAGNTLFKEREPRAVIYARVAHEFGSHGSTEEVSESMSHAFRELPQSIDGHYRFSLEWFRIFNARVMEESGVSGSAFDSAHERLVEIFEDPSTYQLFGEVPEFLEALSEMDLAVGILSNWSERLPLLCKSLGLCEHIDFVVASADIRAEKPERSAFERALFRAGVPAQETVHIGDHPIRDVTGALNAGLRAALLDRDQTSVAPEEGAVVVGDLLELLPLLHSATASSPASA
jgi:putative hydrolase of the HAD superfamily